MQNASEHQVGGRCVLWSSMCMTHPAKEWGHACMPSLLHGDLQVCTWLDCEPVYGPHPCIRPRPHAPPPPHQETISRHNDAVRLKSASTSGPTDNNYKNGYKDIPVEDREFSRVLIRDQGHIRV